MKPGLDRRRFNEPLHDEVATVFTAFDGGASIPKDIVVEIRSDSLKLVPNLSPNGVSNFVSFRRARVASR